MGIYRFPFWRPPRARRTPLGVAGACLSLLAPVPAGAEVLEPIADAHLHYHWNQAEATSPSQAVDLLRRENVVLAVVSSSPPELALRLQEADPQRVIALFSPYLTPEYRRHWYRRPEVLERARQALGSGAYRGIGEVHLIPGLGPSRDNPILAGLMDVAESHRLPFVIHSDASSSRYLAPLCSRRPRLQFVWAHAGGIVPPAEVADLLDICPNLAVDLSARDPARYVRNPIADDSGKLLPAWRAVLLAYPDRFMIGSDAVWPVEQLHGWFEPDTGWQRLGEFLAFHRRWLRELPADVARRIRLDNAQRIYGDVRRPGPIHTGQSGGR